MSTERTEAPTPKRIQDARSEGRVARSPELNAAAALLIGALLLQASGQRLFWDTEAMLGDALAALPSAAKTIAVSQEWISNYVVSSFVRVAPSLGMVVLGLLATGVIVSAGGCGLFEDIQVDLVSGWNLISLHRLPADTAIERVLASIAGRYDSVWGYRGGAWRVFNPDAAGFNDLSVMEPGRGYWINMRQDSVLTIPGGNTVNAIPLFNGWNLVGFNFPYARPAGEATAGIEGGDVAVWGYEDGAWRVYDQSNPGFSDLTMLEPKKGYWIYTNQDCTWSIP